MKTAEFVSPGHPDKIADQISDRILDRALVENPDCKVAIETLVTGNSSGGLVVLGGEMTESTYHEIKEAIPYLVKDVLEDNIRNSHQEFDLSKYTLSENITPQSLEIRDAVVDQKGAGDQGIMVGFATNKTSTLLPHEFDLAREIQMDLWELQKYNLDFGLDAKVQVTENGGYTVVISVQTELEKNEYEGKLVSLVQNIIGPDFTLHVNPSGSFTKGGPAADTGVTGRKIVVDSYGPTIPVGGGAFSGKDPSKVDRSGAYAARHLAVNLVEHGLCEEALVRLSYGIGMEHPIELSVAFNGTEKKRPAGIEKFIQCFDFRPEAIIERLNLKQVQYYKDSQFSHFGDRTRTWEQVDDI